MRSARVRTWALRAALPAALCASAGVALGGCGPGGGERVPPLSGLPLAGGARVTVRVRTCNAGVRAFCGLELVVVGSGVRNSGQLLSEESRLLRRRGWTATDADVGVERAADSPGDRLELTYATADSDLEAIDLGWIHRAQPVARALSRSLFAHAPALSMFLQDGGG